MPIYSTISVKNQARLAHKLVGSYSRIFTVFVKTSGTMIQNHETWDKTEFQDVNISDLGCLNTLIQKYISTMNQALVFFGIK